MYAYDVTYAYRTAKQVCSVLLILCVLVPHMRDFVNVDGWANVVVFGVLLAFLNLAEGAVNRYKNTLMTDDELNERDKIIKDLQKSMKK